MKKGKIIFVSIAGVLIITFSVIAFTPMTVFAELTDEPITDPNPPADGFVVKRFIEGVLIRTFRYQKSMVGYLDSSLSYTDNAAERAKIRIARLEADGKDVSGLESALEQYYEMITDAGKSQDQAESLVHLHNGFTEDGRVQDINSARETIKEIEPLIKSVRDNMMEAFRVLFDAIQKYAENNDA